MIERPTDFGSEETVADSWFNWLNYLQLTESLHDSYKRLTHDFLYSFRFNHSIGNS